MPSDLYTRSLRTPIAFLCCIAVGFGVCAQERGKLSRPNIVVVLADDLGYSDLGCYGGEIPTPNIDALAANGVRFKRFYNSARCCPSRAALLTGLYPHQAGVGSFARTRPEEGRGPGYLGHLRDDAVTFAEILKAEGYGTYMVGKWHVGSDPGPIARGFDEFYGYTQGHSHDQWDQKNYTRLPEERRPELDIPDDEFYATDVFNAYALEFLRQAREKDRPWLLYLAHSSPHFPVQAPRDSIDPLVDTYRKGWDVLREMRFRKQKKLGMFPDSVKLPPRSMVPVDEPAIANGYEGMPNPAWEALAPNRREDLAYRMATFAAMVTHVDKGIGDLVAYLKATGQFANTLILFTSDNGACYEWGPFGFDGRSRAGITKLHEGDELQSIGGPGTHHSYGSGWANLGNTPFRLYKHFNHEGGIVAPCVIHWPAGLEQSGVWIEQRAHIADVMPTLLSAVGAAYPLDFGGKEIQTVEGISLLPAANGNAPVTRRLGFEHQASRAFIDGPWKVAWVGKRWPSEIRWELYNLDEDPTETNDLAGEMSEKLAELTARWHVWAKRVGVNPLPEL